MGDGVMGLRIAGSRLGSALMACYFSGWFGLDGAAGSHTMRSMVPMGGQDTMKGRYGDRTP